ncbi:MAG: SseB family protein [Cellulomonadaceae bacterium]|nr:SseB family protein [Cellulomonadaceae bacterium]
MGCATPPGSPVSQTPAHRALPPTSPFAGDDGSPDGALTAALARWSAGQVELVEVVAALASARVLVPVLAHAVATDVVDGLEVDRQADTGVVALQVPDGRTALPVFSGVASLAAWRSDARPVPTPAGTAAVSALAEGWQVMVLDPGGPITVVVPRPAVQALAAGRQWEPPVSGGAVRPDVSAAVARVLTGLDAVEHVDVVAGRHAEIAVVLGLRPGMSRTELSAVLEGVNGRLAGDPLVSQVDSIELRPVSARA